MKNLYIEILNINKMASGHLCLDITSKISWEDFPQYADNLIEFLKGEVLSKLDGPDVRLWEVIVSGLKYRLAFDDYPLMVSLESNDDEADSEIVKIRESLTTQRGSH